MKSPPQSPREQVQERERELSEAEQTPFAGGAGKGAEGEWGRQQQGDAQLMEGDM